MQSQRCLARWFGCLFVAVLSVPPLAAEAQVRVPPKSNNTASSFAPPASALTQPTVDVPEHATLDYSGRAWECKRGYRRADNECIAVALPVNATLDYSGHAWECKRGYRRSGTECVVVPMPAHATLDYSGHAWECKRGYRRSGNECVVVPVPANATLDYSGRAWECKHGYRLAGTECVLVLLPANAAIDYSGHAWECKRGYRRSGTECVVVPMPANTTWDYSGQVWECEYGYRRVGAACEKKTALPETAMYGSLAVQEAQVNPQQHNDSTEAIRHIQAQLKKAGFDPGPLDGVLGPRTMKALHRSLAPR